MIEKHKQLVQKIEHTFPGWSITYCRDGLIDPDWNIKASNGNTTLGARNRDFKKALRYVSGYIAWEEWLKKS